MSVKFEHKGLAETHDFGFGTTFGIEIGAAFSGAERESGQGVFKNLFEAEKFDDSRGDAGVKAQSAFVGAERGIELNAITCIDVDLSLIVHPSDAEGDHLSRFDEPRDDSVLRVATVHV